MNFFTNKNQPIPTGTKVVAIDEWDRMVARMNMLEAAAVQQSQTKGKGA
jgi:hypothetical protein